jgi:hypothetical protein
MYHSATELLCYKGGKQEDGWTDSEMSQLFADCVKKTGFDNDRGGGLGSHK